MSGLIFSFSALYVFAVASPHELVFVQGGLFKNGNSNYYGKHVSVSNFYMARFPVTQREWAAVMGKNPSHFKGQSRPVEMVSWYDAIEYCNRRSEREGLQLVYSIEKLRKDPNNLVDPEIGTDVDTVKWIVKTHPAANGYRLPTEAEYEYAASGGARSKGHVYPGSDSVDEVAWSWKNSGDKYLPGLWQLNFIKANHCRSMPVGRKRPNEIGLYDMSGNVREWCWDWYADLPKAARDPVGPPAGYGRVWKGGGWLGDPLCCKIDFRAHLPANGYGPDQGFRVCRSSLASTRPRRTGASSKRR